MFLAYILFYLALLLSSTLRWTFLGAFILGVAINFEWTMRIMEIVLLPILLLMRLFTEVTGG
jgi:hypothetical protein